MKRINWNDIWYRFDAVMECLESMPCCRPYKWTGVRGENAYLKGVLESQDIIFSQDEWKKFNIDFQFWYDDHLFYPHWPEQKKWIQSYLNKVIRDRR